MSREAPAALAGLDASQAAGAIYLATGDTREALILLGFVFITTGITALQ